MDRFQKLSDILCQSEEFTRYLAYDSQTGLMVNWYDYKVNYIVPFIRNVPSSIILDHAVQKNGTVLIITSFRPSSSVTSIFRREQQSDLKMSRQLLQNWANQLLVQFQQYKIYDPRIEFISIDTQLGEAFFELPAFFPYQPQISQRFEQQFGHSLPELQNKEQIADLIYNFYYMNQSSDVKQQNTFAIKEITECKVCQQNVTQCTRCKQVCFLFKQITEMRIVQCDQVAQQFSQSCKRLLENISRFSSTQHCEHVCQVMQFIQQPQVNKKYHFQSFCVKNYVDNVCVRLLYSLVSIVCDSYKQYQNFILLLDQMQIQQLDLKNMIENIDQLDEGRLAIVQCMFGNAELGYDDLKLGFDMLGLKMCYSNKRELSQNVVFCAADGRQWVYAVLREGQIEEVLENLAGQVGEDDGIPQSIVLQMVRQDPPVW